MKKSVVLIFLCLFGFHTFSQLSNLVFYNNDGYPFFVVLNGVKQNENPETNVKITNLNQPFYKVEIIFDDANMGSIQKNLNFNQGMETVYAIKKNKKGVYIIRWQSETPLAQVTSIPNQTTIVYTNTPPANTTVTTTETTTTTTTGNTNNVNVGVNVGNTNLNMNVNVNDGGTGVSSSTTTTTSSTTTTTTSTTEDVTETQVVYLPGYTGQIGCPVPLSDAEFQNVKHSISSKSFDDTKLTIAKQVINTNCLLSRHVKEILFLFDFEDTRLELAKYAYMHTYDISNYYMLNDAFDFESTIEELNEYINGL